jgi:hypothetical protein
MLVTNAPISGASRTACRVVSAYDPLKTMMSRARRHPALATAVVVAVLAADTSAHVPLRPPGSIYVGINLEVGGAPFAAKGTGECRYAADASIDRVPGQMWTVRRRDSGQDVNFTLWRLRQGGEMFTLNVTSGGKMHRVNTIQASPADRRGSGSASISTQGGRGKFSIDAVDDTGVRVTGTLSCSAFTAA